MSDISPKGLGTSLPNGRQQKGNLKLGPKGTLSEETSGKMSGET